MDQLILTKFQEKNDVKIECFGSHVVGLLRSHEKLYHLPIAIGDTNMANSIEIQENYGKSLPWIFKSLLTSPNNFITLLLF